MRREVKVSVDCGPATSHGGMLVGGVVVEDCVDGLPAEIARSTAFTKRMNS
jgi:hypothetical protein